MLAAQCLRLPVNIGLLSMFLVLEKIRYHQITYKLKPIVCNCMIVLCTHALVDSLQSLVIGAWLFYPRLNQCIELKIAASHLGRYQERA